MTLSTTSPGDEREAFKRPENYDRVSADVRQSLLMNLERHLVAMQAALIEARENGPLAGLAWIANTLDGPGLIPDGDETDAQAYFDLHAPSIDACCFDRASSSTVQQVGAEWMPISSAPKDGGEFLACFVRQGNVVQVVKWNALHGFWQSKGEPLIGFSTNATHWARLPALPKSSQGDQQ